ncbi:Cullin-3, partial [Tulasnella sp. 417]
MRKDMRLVRQTWQREWPLAGVSVEVLDYICWESRFSFHRVSWFRGCGRRRAAAYGEELDALVTTAPSNDTRAEGDGEGEEATEDTKAKGQEEFKALAPKGAASRATEAALQWMQSALDLKDKTDKLLTHCFADEFLIQTTLINAFETFINDDPKSPEYISLFIDENLRKGRKT